MNSFFPAALAASFLLWPGVVMANPAPEAQQSLEPVTLDLSKEVAAVPLDSPQSVTPIFTLDTTKIGIPQDRVGSFATVITRQEIEQMQETSLVEVLRRVPGVDVIQNGGPGNTASIFIRGMNPEHTLFLVDGIEMNDSISPGRTFNFPDQISLDSVDRIEILRGPHSTLYGSDAMGGVINVITELGEGRPKIYAKALGGSYGSVMGNVGLRGGLANNRLRFNLHAMRQGVNGFSAAGNRYGNHERDGFENTALVGRIAYQPLPNVTLDLLSRYADSETELDNFGGFGGDDPNYTMRNKTLLLSAGSRVTLLKERLEQITRLSVTDNRRRATNDFDAANPFDSERSRFNSQLLKLDVQNNFRLHRTNTLTAGFELNHERGELANEFQSQFGPFVSEFEERTATNIGFYLQDYIQIGERWFTTLGLRGDSHNRFGKALTYRAATTYIVPKTETILRSSIGTGFKAPTLYQLYSAFGTRDLAPERSRSWDIGLEQALFKDQVRVGATYFRNRVNEMILFNPATFFYENIGKAKMQGSEVYLSSSPFRWLTTRASYTYTATRDLEQHEPLLRRPRHKMALNFNFQPLEKLNVNLDLVRASSRDDLDFATFPASKVNLSPYTLVRLAVNYQLTKACTLFGRLVNVFDVPYEDVKGYGAPRLSAYGGVRIGM